MRRPLVAPSLFLMLGTLLGRQASVTEAWWLVGLGFAALALALGRARVWVAAGGVVAAALAIGVAVAAAEQASFEAASLRSRLGSEFEDPVRVEGRALADAGEREGRTSVVLVVDHVTSEGRPLRVEGRVRVAIAGDVRPPEIIEGDQVSLWTQLWRPRGPRNPGGADVEADARREGLHAFGYCKSGRLVDVAPPRARDWASRVAQWRAAIRHRLQAFVPAGQEQAVVRAMVLGDRTALDRQTAEAFRVAGTYHVLALSGAQVALVVALALLALRRVGLPPAGTAVLVSALVVAYAALVGGDVPVVRAAVLAVIVLLGRALDLDADLVNLLALAAGVLLLARPADIGDLGFQLSFAATLGLLVLEPPVRSFFPRLPFGIDLAVASSVAAQLALAPLLAFHFHRLAPAALVLNLIAVPLASLVLLVGAATVAVSGMPPLAHALGLVAFGSARALLWTGTLVDGVPWLDARVPTPPASLCLLHLAALAALAAGRRPRLSAAGAVATTLLLAGGLPQPRPDSGVLQLTMLDVGQGDALVLRSPHGRVWMVDAGGSYDGRFDVGESVLGPYFWSQGVRTIDGLLLSHAHPDHVGGVPFLLESFRVGDVWEGLAPRHDRGYALLDAALRSAGVPRRSVVRGVSWVWDGVRFDVLGPGPRRAPPVVTRNDDSVVLLVAFGDVRLLLAGDVEASGEAALQSGPVSVLKVPHHGSRTSSSAGFVASTAPRVALISVGRHSPFGHPHAEVLDRYRRAGVRVFRTDRDGAVTLTTDGHTLDVRTETGGEHRVQ